MNDTTLPTKRNNKSATTLRPGFGLHDWMNLLRHAKDLAQRRGKPIRRSIPLSEIQQHNKPYDGWMILRGKVYNISPYLAYHPGGQEILNGCLGRDATKLFDKYHSWVNLDGLIGPLLLGYVQIEKRHEDETDGGGGGGGYLNGKVGDGTMKNDSDIVLPSSSLSSTNTNAATTTSSAAKMSSQSIEFSMPKPRPPKGSTVPSLLGANNDDGDEEEEEELL
mmetsp:Transcript_14551/g.23830  ORF Transcript_14551/g.23830 Transcript_14551/m.23830 type:complete len:221 (-) Transcript_14551:190-852(-)